MGERLRREWEPPEWTAMENCDPEAYKPDPELPIPYVPPSLPPKAIHLLTYYYYQNDVASFAERTAYLEQSGSSNELFAKLLDIRKWILWVFENNTDLVPALLEKDRHDPLEFVMKTAGVKMNEKGRLVLKKPESSSRWTNKIPLLRS